MEETNLVVAIPSWGDLAFLDLDERRDREALVFPDGRLTYGEFADRVAWRGRALLGMGIRPGDHVGILMPNSLDYLELLFAIASVGAVAVVINSRYRAYELTYVVENSDLRLLLVAGVIADDLDFAVRLCEAFADLPSAPDPHNLALAAAPRLQSVVIFGEARPGFVGQAEFEAWAEPISLADFHRARVAVRLRDPFMIMYTSGTTSLPKGCVLSHESVVKTVYHAARRQKLCADDRYWTPLPLFHLGSLNPLGSVLLTGGTFISAPQFEAGGALRQLEEEGATLAFFGFPPIINGILNHPDRHKHDLSKLRALMCSASVQPKTIQQRLAEAFPDVVQIGMYGMTEGGSSGTCTGVDDGEGAGFRALGRPLPGVGMRIVREDGSACDVGEVGEILFNGFGIMHGYYRDPEKTAEFFHDGWAHSGDLGSFNEYGELRFHGRSKDMLKVGGENVASAEIEEFLHQHPAVKLCAVVGAPDERLTEVAAAFVELHEDMRADGEELIEFCRGRIASFKVPRHIRFVTEWPTTASSKIQKTKLAEALRRELEPAED